MSQNVSWLSEVVYTYPECKCTASDLSERTTVLSILQDITLNNSVMHEVVKLLMTRKKRWLILKNRLWDQVSECSPCWSKRWFSGLYLLSAGVYRHTPQPARECFRLSILTAKIHTTVCKWLEDITGLSVYPSNTTPGTSSSPFTFTSSQASRLFWIYLLYLYESCIGCGVQDEVLWYLVLMKLVSRTIWVWETVKGSKLIW